VNERFGEPGCIICSHQPVDHAPQEDELCASCGEPYMRGCKERHHHNSYVGCWDYQDIRKLWCGCYAHKECQKSGNVCREHGPIGGKSLLVDCYGTEIEPGAKVAFNFCGGVRLGEVVELGKVADGVADGTVKPDRWGCFPRLRIRVRHSDKPDHVSVVTAANNLAVLKEG
jgi:hypothetical protein